MIGNILRGSISKLGKACELKAAYCDYFGPTSIE